jgi:hypothetical protein
MEVIIQLQAPAALPKEGIPVRIEQKAGWATKPVWTFGEAKNLFSLPRFQSRIIQSKA